MLLGANAFQELYAIAGVTALAKTTATFRHALKFKCIILTLALKTTTTRTAITHARAA